MLNKGDKLRVTRADNPQWPKLKNRKGKVYYADRFKIVVEFKALKSENMSFEPSCFESDESFRETFILADIIEKKVKLEVWKNKQWVLVGEEIFK